MDLSAADGTLVLRVRGAGKLWTFEISREIPPHAARVSRMCAQGREAAKVV